MWHWRRDKSYPWINPGLNVIIYDNYFQLKLMTWGHVLQTGFFVLCSGLEKTLWLRPFLYLHIQRGKDPKTCNKRVKESVFFFFFWWLQMAFIAVCYMFVDLFALQHIADRQGLFITLCWSRQYGFKLVPHSRDLNHNDAQDRSAMIPLFRERKIDCKKRKERKKNAEKERNQQNK